MHLMNTRGWTPAQIDEIDVHYYFELLAHQEKMNDPKEKRKRKWRNQKVVPIDAVF
ncbi:hypothetical protein [Bacillus methanolicus]|uniref:hypothetical protein n=1 Tax=Bacillus methanolicus TaxID=1471 RepID=UPI00200C1E48|nr:hypothetical protein [Bacillus methanolicus]